MVALREDLELGAALRQVAGHGFSFVPVALDERFRRRCRTEIDAGPFRHFQEEFSRVRQQIDGFDVGAPFRGYPALAGLSREVTALVHRDGRGVRGLATWRVNEAGVAHYRPDSLGITPHMDGKWYRRLVVVVTLYGTARFAVCSDREGTVVDEWHTGPGSLMLMRGPGLAGARDGRPLHTAGTPRRGERCSIGLRMSVRPRAGA